MAQSVPAPGPQKSLDDAQAEFLQALLAKNQTAATVMVKQYAKVYDELTVKAEKLLAELTAANLAGEALPPVFFMKLQRIEALKNQIAVQIARFAKDAEASVAAQQALAVQLGTDHAQKLIQAALAETATGYTYSFQKLPSGALERLVGALSDGSPLRDLFDTLGPNAADNAGEILFRAVSTGLHPTVAAAQLKQALGVPLTRALAIARTEMLRSYRESTRAVYQRNSDVVKAWRWNAKLDRRTCPACWAMHGTIHSLDERLDEHVNGRCAMAPVTRTWEELGFPKDVADLAPPPPPSKIPGTKAFAALSEADQLAILGPGKLKLYKSGQIRLEDLVHQTFNVRWGSMRREASIAQALANHGQPKPWFTFKPPSVTPHPLPPPKPALPANPIDHVKALLKADPTASPTALAMKVNQDYAGQATVTPLQVTHAKQALQKQGAIAKPPPKPKKAPAPPPPPARVFPATAKEYLEKQLIKDPTASPSALAKKANQFYPNANVTPLQVTHQKQALQKKGVLPKPAPKAAQGAPGQPTAPQGTPGQATAAKAAKTPDPFAKVHPAHIKTLEPLHKGSFGHLLTPDEFAAHLLNKGMPIQNVVAQTNNVYAAPVMTKAKATAIQKGLKAGTITPPQFNPAGLQAPPPAAPPPPAAAPKIASPVLEQAQKNLFGKVLTPDEYVAHLLNNGADVQIAATSTNNVYTGNPMTVLKATSIKNGLKAGTTLPPKVISTAAGAASSAPAPAQAVPAFHFLAKDKQLVEALLHSGQVNTSDILSEVLTKYPKSKLTEKDVSHIKDVLQKKGLLQVNQPGAGSAFSSPPHPTTPPAAKTAAAAKPAPVVEPKLPERKPPFDVAELQLDPGEGSGLGGAHTKAVYRDKSGNLWLFKPQEAFRAELDAATARIAERAGFGAAAPETYTVTIGGQTGSIQRMFGTKATRRAAFRFGDFDPTKLDQNDMSWVQKHGVFDWMVGNHDGHVDQFVRISGDRTIYGIDKGQAFKFFSQDKLDFNYAPNAKFGVDSIYNKVHRAYAEGENVSLALLTGKGPQADELRDFIKQLQAIDDGEYRAMLRPYAEGAHKAGFLAHGDVETFLQKAVERKNNLLADWTAFHKRLEDLANQALAAKLPKPPPGLVLQGMQGAREFADNHDGVAWANKHFPMPDPSIPQAEVDAVRTYTGSAYVTINGALRKGKSNQYVAPMDRFFKHYSIPEDVVVVRGTGTNSFDRPVDKIAGTIQQDPGYLSTSVGTSAAFGHQPVIMRFRVPKGTPGYFVERISLNKGERELLLTRGLKYYVHKAELKNGKWYVDAEILAPQFQGP